MIHHDHTRSVHEAARSFLCDLVLDAYITIVNGKDAPREINKERLQKWDDHLADLKNCHQRAWQPELHQGMINFGESLVTDLILKIEGRINEMSSPIDEPRLLVWYKEVSHDADQCREDKVHY